MTNNNSNSQNKNRRNNNNNKPGGQKPGNRNSRPNSNRGNSSRNNKRRFFGKNKHHQDKGNSQRGALPSDKLSNQYLELLERLLKARNDLFYSVYKANDQRRRKLENNYSNALQRLRDFEVKLPENKKLIFEKKYHSAPEDLVYSANHQGDLEEYCGSENFELPTEFSDPHLREQQVQSEFKDDSEESVGSMEDYQAYKEAMGK
jgi:hypothetical protein